MFVINANNNTNDLGFTRIFSRAPQTTPTHSGATNYLSDLITKEVDGVYYYAVREALGTTNFRGLKLLRNSFGTENNVTKIGFGTSTTNPKFFIGQFKAGGCFMYVEDNGGDTTINNNGIYSITLNGALLEITLGSLIATRPTIAGKTLVGIFGHEANKIYAFYSDNTTKNIDTAQKRDGTSRSSMTGNAIPSNVGLAKTANFSKNIFGVGVNFSRQFYWIFCELSEGACVFDAETEERKVMSGYDIVATADCYSVDIDGFLLNKGNIFNTNGEVREYGAIKVVTTKYLYFHTMSRYGRHMHSHSSTTIRIACNAVVLKNGRLRRAIGEQSQTQTIRYGCVYSVDGGQTRKGMTFLGDSTMGFGIRGDLVVCSVGTESNSTQYNTAIEVV